MRSKVFCSPQRKIFYVHLLIFTLLLVLLILSFIITATSYHYHSTTTLQIREPIIFIVLFFSLLSSYDMSSPIVRSSF